ncbi:hypothetical protein, partial [Vibrio anguillarum]|uniref:hypothetical protein n=1 Tax=Vibrio anguillarum TaxID=55601 RepID=UPI00188C9ED5
GVMNENIIAGLVSGLIVSLVVVLARHIWQSTIVPWFENRVFKDVKIEGQWFSYYTGSMLGREEIITLKRQGHEIEGTMVCISKADHGERYCLQGSFRNLILPLTYETQDQTKTDRGTITLKAANSAEMLKGKICLYSCDTDDIRTSEVTWYRSKEDMLADKKKHEVALKEGFSQKSKN